MKITESMRLEAALEMIEEASACAQSTNPKRDWKDSYKTICFIYEMVHSIRSPKCRKNHPKWCAQIDAAIVEKRKDKV